MIRTDASRGCLCSDGTDEREREREREREKERKRERCGECVREKEAKNKEQE
jgi:hypothetical protein